MSTDKGDDTVEETTEDIVEEQAPDDAAPEEQAPEEQAPEDAAPEDAPDDGGADEPAEAADHVEPEDLTDDMVAGGGDYGGFDASDPESMMHTASEALNAAVGGVDPHTNGGGEAPSDNGGDGHTDVAIASLCQSYAHALSIAFHDAVQQQQRRSALAQAALARAIEQIQAAESGDFEEKLAQLKKGLDVVGGASGDDMTVFSDLADQFQSAASKLMDVRERMGG